MKKNMGTLDRIVRVIIAITLLLLFYFDIIPGALGLTLAGIGVIFVLTSLTSFCPIYAIFGLKTCKTSHG